MNLTEGDDSLLRLLFITKVMIACYGFCLSRHTKTWLARDIISYSGMMFCTLLHCELRDYSLGQIENKDADETREHSGREHILA